VDRPGDTLPQAVPTIKIAAALILDEKNRMLLVRKAGTKFFMQPGGKIETSESPESCLVRELDTRKNRLFFGPPVPVPALWRTEGSVSARDAPIWRRNRPVSALPDGLIL